MKYLNPKADLTFKRIFGEHPDLVMSLLNALEESAFTDAQLAGYEKFWDIISVEKTLCSSFERRGIAEGLKQGIKQGKLDEQRLIAANFKKQGIAFELIAQCTGLSSEEIAAL